MRTCAEKKKGGQGFAYQLAVAHHSNDRQRFDAVVFRVEPLPSRLGALVAEHDVGVHVGVVIVEAWPPPCEVFPSPGSTNLQSRAADPTHTTTLMQPGHIQAHHRKTIKCDASGDSTELRYY